MGVVKSKTYKGVRNFGVTAVLPCAPADVTLQTVVTIKIKGLGRECSDSPWKITVGEWRAAGKASCNPNYDYMMLFQRFNPEGYPQVQRLGEEAIKACKELLGYMEPPNLTRRR